MWYMSHRVSIIVLTVLFCVATSVIAVTWRVCMCIATYTLDMFEQS